MEWNERNELMNDWMGWNGIEFPKMNELLKE